MRYTSEFALLRAEARKLAEETKLNKELAAAELKRRKALTREVREKREQEQRNNTSLPSDKVVKDAWKAYNEWSDAVDQLGESVKHLKEVNGKVDSALSKAESMLHELGCLLAIHGIVRAPTYRKRQFLQTRAPKPATPRSSSAAPKRSTLFQPFSESVTRSTACIDVKRLPSVGARR